MGWKAAMIMFFVMMGLSSAMYVYYKNTQETIRILTENNAKLEIAVKTNEETIASLEANYAAAQQEMQAINAEYADIRNQNKQLRGKLETIDLGVAAENNPEGIGRAVNRGTINAGRCFEILSGAQQTEDEINAEDAKSWNKECPWLWPGPTTDGVLGEPAAASN